MGGMSVARKNDAMTSPIVWSRISDKRRAARTERNIKDSFNAEKGDKITDGI